MFGCWVRRLGMVELSPKEKRIGPTGSAYSANAIIAARPRESLGHSPASPP